MDPSQFLIELALTMLLVVGWLDLRWHLRHDREVRERQRAGRTARRDEVA